MELLTIENKAAKLKLNDVVHQPSMDRLISEIGKVFGAQAFEAGLVTGEITNCIENAADTLEIEIHSPGGSVLDGYVLYNELLALRARGVEVTATINSLAASMASVIAMAADKIRIVPQGRMMIHDAQTGVRGNAGELRKWADELEKTSNQIADIYAGRTGQPKEKVREWMLAETWMTADEAKENGFVDEIVSIKFDTKTKAMSILSKLFPGNDQVAQLEAQIAENDTLRAELTEAQAKIAELSGSAEVIATLQSNFDDVSAKLADAEKLANEQAQTIADLQEKATVTEDKVSIAAAELLAATGHPAPVELNEAAVFTSHLDKFNELKGSEATAYWKKHQKEIKAEQLALSQK